MLATQHNGHIIKNMKKFWVLVLGLVLFNLCPVKAASTGLSICEIQTESLTSASEEFIRICNSSADKLDVTGWYLQYFSASATAFTSPTRNVLLSGIIESSGDYIVASTGYMSNVARSTFGATLSSTGGHVRLVSSAPAAQEVDRVGWGTALTPESEPAAVVAKGKTFVRQAVGSTYVDTDNNKLDFSVIVPNQQTPEESSATSYASITITELLPDPASPISDSEGEFVELFNESNASVDLSGYKLQTGTTFSYSYTFDKVIIPGQSYAVYYAPITKLTLSNTSGAARLLAPDGSVINVTASYDKAPTGSSWSLVGDTWDWSTTVTAGTANIYTSANDSASNSSSAAVKATKSKSSTKTTGTKAASTTKAASQKSAYVAPAPDKSPLPVNPFVLAGVGVIAVGYMVYEYRHDIAHRFRQFRSNRTYRRSTRP